MKSRQGQCNHGNLLTGKLWCTCCGAPYYRRESKDKQGNINSKWVCSAKINNGASSCPSVPIYESEIKPLLFEVFRDTEANVKALIEEYVEMYRAMSGSGELIDQIAAQKHIIDLAVRKKGKLLEYNVTGQMSDKEFLQMRQACDREIDQAQERLDELQKQQESNDAFLQHIEAIRAALTAAAKDAADGLITRTFVEKYIDKIFVTPEDGNTVRLEIKIFTGESTEKYLQKLRQSRSQKTLENQGITDDDAKSRTGQMSKKMIQSYENGLSSNQ